MYFASLEKILLEQSVANKISFFQTFYQKYKNDLITFESSFSPITFEKPSYDSFTTTILPKQTKKREHLHTKEGKQLLLHTIAHIEYSAIDLALDAAYRFVGMPKRYYDDWLEVAQDEIRHFLMLERLMDEVDIRYGDLPVHTNLFLAMQKTQTLIERMAIVPRYLEANGLEQNPNIMKKISGTPDAFNSKILQALEIILKEEIAHVTKGDFWFKYGCKLAQLEPEETYLAILEKFYPGSTQKTMQLNFTARKLCGFSCNELKTLSKQQEC